MEIGSDQGKFKQKHHYSEDERERMPRFCGYLPLWAMMQKPESPLVIRRAAPDLVVGDSSVASLRRHDRTGDLRRAFADSGNRCSWAFAPPQKA
jgi:hypothetical protein